ncbi:ribose ABC transporter permease [Tissierella sp. P1]|jgi:ribose transport system permease protein|uniref:ribose ABC transporter permease n=1 Tax=Tissierella TaxID=41273 RepID=UPI000BA18918|nr:ribose ABC transporter permease [Tissierella sp. P1]MDU5080357.1 ribose ABC transporter permease [Bacillota bacterium]OZV13831.1 ribose ABC transporter permease [Tissierella sp. P1]
MENRNLDKLRPIIGLIIFSVIISILNPRFLTMGNLLNVFRQTSINAIIAAGMTFVILSAGIDLSVGSILGFSGAVGAKMLASGYNIWLSLLVAIVIGAVAGIVNGIIITRGKVQPFIATLAIMILLRGATMVFTSGRPIPVSGEHISGVFRWIGTGVVLGIPVPIAIMIIVFIVCYYILNHTQYGRHLYAVGGNEEASLLSGVNTAKIKILAYTASGILAAIAGIIVTSRLSSAQPTSGEGYELDAIAAVVLGGTSLVGGQGTIIGTIIGALIIGILNNALNLMDVQSYYQMIAKAIVIIVAVLLDKKEKTK